jgi:hypothetical protein
MRAPRIRRDMRPDLRGALEGGEVLHEHNCANRLEVKDEYLS